MGVDVNPNEPPSAGRQEYAPKQSFRHTFVRIKTVLELASFQPANIPLNPSDVGFVPADKDRMRADVI
jgi:hypothetical protein